MLPFFRNTRFIKINNILPYYNGLFNTYSYNNTKRCCASFDPLSEKEKKLIACFSNKSELLAHIEAKRNDMISKLSFLQMKGYKINETDDKVFVTNEKDARSITISWDPNLPIPKEKERSLKDSILYEDIPVTISIKMNSKTLFLSGLIGDSHQLLLFNIKPGRVRYYGEEIKFAKLSEEIQLKFYDYMEVLGTGDGMASFIANYNQSRRLQYIGKELVNIKSILTLENKEKKK